MMTVGYAVSMIAIGLAGASVACADKSPIASAGFARNENGRLTRGDTPEAIEHVAHAGRAPDDAVELFVLAATRGGDGNRVT